MAFSTMDSLQSSQLALIRLRQTPSILPAKLLLIHTRTRHSTPQAALKHPQSFQNTTCKSCSAASAGVIVFLHGGTWSLPGGEIKDRAREKEGGREGRMNEGNTHLLFLRGSGKSFWKKDKGKENKREIRYRKILTRAIKKTFIRS